MRVLQALEYFGVCSFDSALTSILASADNHEELEINLLFFSRRFFVAGNEDLFTTETEPLVKVMELLKTHLRTKKKRTEYFLSDKTLKILGEQIKTLAYMSSETVANQFIDYYWTFYSTLDAAILFTKNRDLFIKLFNAPRLALFININEKSGSITKLPYFADKELMDVVISNCIDVDNDLIKLLRVFVKNKIPTGLFDEYLKMMLMSVGMHSNKRNMATILNSLSCTDGYSWSDNRRKENDLKMISMIYGILPTHQRTRNIFGLCQFQKFDIDGDDHELLLDKKYKALICDLRYKYTGHLKVGYESIDIIKQLMDDGKFDAKHGVFNGDFYVLGYLTIEQLRDVVKHASDELLRNIVTQVGKVISDDTFYLDSAGDVKTSIGQVEHMNSVRNLIRIGFFEDLSDLYNNSSAKKAIFTDEFMKEIQQLLPPTILITIV